jgi:hypothetical protein
VVQLPTRKPVLPRSYLPVEKNTCERSRVGTSEMTQSQAEQTARSSAWL